MTRHRHNLEKLMVRVLFNQREGEPLSINEIVDKIKQILPEALPGKTPNKSLYSTIYRREKRRKRRGLPTAFIVQKKDLVARYSLNPAFNREEAGKKI